MANAELFQGCTEYGDFSSPGLERQQVAGGALHASSHVWIVREGVDGLEVLLQLRAQDKATWPGYWDISAAGHVDFGESAFEAAKRETREEIGVEIDDNALSLLFVRRDLMKFDDFIENELRWVYLYVWQDAEVTLQDDEVEKLEWVALDDFVSMAQDPGAHKLVDQGTMYFATLVDYLRLHENN